MHGYKPRPRPDFFLQIPCEIPCRSEVFLYVCPDLSATNRDPAAEVRAGRLREDLFYRLNVLPIRLPPLRDRIEDILPLAKAFLCRYGREEGRSPGSR